MRAGAAARRLDQRVRPHDRAAQRPDRGHRRPARRPRPATASERVGLGVGERPLLPLPRRHGLRRRGGRSRSSAGRGSSATPATRCSCTPASTPGSATTTAAGRGSRCATPTARWSTTATSSICLNTNPYTYLGNRPLDLAPEATLDRGLAMVTLRTLAFARIDARSSARRSAAGKHLRRSRVDRPPHRPRPAPRSRATARSRTRSTATTSATPSSSRSATSPTSSTSSCPCPTRPARRALDRRTAAAAAEGARATSGTLVIDGVDAEVGEPADALGLVAGPGVHGQPGVVGDAHEVLVRRTTWCGWTATWPRVGGPRRPASCGVVDEARAASRWRARAPARAHGRSVGQVEARHERSAVVELAAAAQQVDDARRRPARWGRSPGRRASS